MTSVVRSEDHSLEFPLQLSNQTGELLLHYKSVKIKDMLIVTSDFLLLCMRGGCGDIVN